MSKKKTKKKKAKKQKPAGYFKKGSKKK